MLAIYRQFAKGGHQPIVVAPADRDEEEKFEGGRIISVKDTFETKAVYKGVLTIASGLIQNLGSIFKLEKFIRQEKPDLVIFQPSFLALAAMLIKPLFQNTKFIFRHEDLIANLAGVRRAGRISKLLASFLEWYLCFFSDYVFTTQKSQKEGLMQQYGKFGLARSKIIVLPYTVNLAFLASKKGKVKTNAPTAYTFIYVGGMGYRQDIPSFLSLLLPTLRKRKDLKFLFVGKGLDNDLLAYIRENKLEGSVELRPPVNYNAVPNLINAADFGLVILKNDKGLEYSIPSKFIEYLALGKPVLAYGPPGGELEKAIVEGKVGVFLRKGSDVEKEIEMLVRNSRSFSDNSSKAVSESNVFKTADVFVDYCEALLESLQR